MEVYHLGKTKFAGQLTGEGAKLHGGRWNLIGTPCIYTSETRALSVLEYAANVRFDEIPASLSITVYTLPDKSWIDFNEEELPQNWQQVPAPQMTKEWGSFHLQAKNYLAFKIPSVVISSEFNFILNPLHTDFKKVKIKEITPFSFDRRIKK